MFTEIPMTTREERGPSRVRLRRTAAEEQEAARREDLHSILMRALAPYPEAREAVVRALSGEAP